MFQTYPYLIAKTTPTRDDATVQAEPCTHPSEGLFITFCNRLDIKNLTATGRKKGIRRMIICPLELQSKTFALKKSPWTHPKKKKRVDNLMRMIIQWLLLIVRVVDK